VSAASAPARAWQDSTLLDLTGTAAQRFMRVIEEIPARTRFTINDIRPRLDDAEVPNDLRGGLIHAAKEAGLIEPVTVSAWGVDYDVRVRSTGTSARSATVRVYRRLGDVDAADSEPAGGPS
jgi:hypothetical protein